MAGQPPAAVVAGHICLDIIPAVEKTAGGFGDFLVPGRMCGIGPAVISTGGAVSNTGLALHRLGISTRMIGKVGEDLFGRAIIDILDGYGPELSNGMVVAGGEQTSYSIVISPPGTDRMILHCTGANDTFTVRDIDPAALAGARLFHFGYPPAMAEMYSGDGRELEQVFRIAKQEGLTTTLDTSVPDPETGSGKADWREIFRRSLPLVDVFMPSIEELLYMIDRKNFDRLEREHGSDIAAGVDGLMLGSLSETLIEMGTAMAVIKLGGRGIYVRTADDKSRIAGMGRGVPEDAEAWVGREMAAPCFRVEVAGNTGSGDSTAAGFIAGLLKGLSPDMAMTSALAVGAFNVEKPDAVSGIPAWNKVEERIASEWPRLDAAPALPGWEPSGQHGIFLGPDDAGR